MEGRGHGPDDGVSGQCALELLGFETIGPGGPSGAGEDFERFAQARAQSPGTASQLKKRPQIPQAGSNQIGRRHRERGLDEVGDALQHGLIFG